MPANRTFTPLTGTGAGNAYQTGDKFGYQTAEKIRQALDQALYLPILDLGGEERGITVNVAATFQTVWSFRSYDLNGDSLGGLTLEAVLFYYTSNAATTVDVRVRNTTSPATAAQLAAPSASTTVQTTVRTMTMASGIQTYRLELTASNVDNPVYAWGYLRFRTIPA